MASTSRQTSDIASSTCQRCRQPLLLDPSITSLSPQTQNLITSALPTPSEPSKFSPKSKLRSLPPSSQPAAQIWSDQIRPGTESFILLSSSGPSLLQPDKVTTNLHSILSSRTPIDHPLCIECTTLLQSELQKELEELSRERDAYIAFERGIVSATGSRRSEDEGLGEYDVVGDEDEWEALTRRQAELGDEEERLRKVLEEKEKELAIVVEEEHRMRAQEEEVDRQEEEFLQEHHNLSTSLNHLTNQLRTAQTHLLLSQSLLAHLESTNVYNDAFQIGHVPLHPPSTGHSVTVGTINGLRLGGRPVVEWDEVNAAWGLVALCIDRIAAKVGCELKLYKILPLGSFSRIEDLPPSKNSYELYASSDLSPARILQNRRFNQGLVALLELLRQLVEFGREGDRGWGVGNIEIHKDKISSHSIRLPGLTMSMPTMSFMGGSASSSEEGDEQWTRACRAVLLVLKRILVVESEGDRVGVAARVAG